ncbi:MAG: hypothetical protein R2754_10470 [Microthrixaceae bacterium]
MNRTRATAVLVVVVVALAVVALAMNGRNTSGEAQATTTTALGAVDLAYALDMTRAFSEQGNASYPAESVRCLFSRLAGSVGAKRLRELGFVPESFEGDLPGTDWDALADTEQQAVTESFLECVDLRTVIGPPDVTPQEMATCLDDLDWEELERAAAKALITGAVESGATEQIGNCLPADADADQNATTTPGGTTPEDAAPVATNRPGSERS